MMTKAVLDACVLYPAQLRDFFLRLAEGHLIDPFWSEEIQNEWTRNVLKNCPEVRRERLERTHRKMNTRFPHSLVWGYESLVSTLQLPDPNDRHVLAVAIHTKAKNIVTFNLKHFPKPVLQLYSIETVSPDEFVSRLIREAPILVLQVANDHRLSLFRPSLSATEYIAMLERQGLSQTAIFLWEHESEV